MNEFIDPTPGWLVGLAAVRMRGAGARTAIG